MGLLHPHFPQISSDPRPVHVRTGTYLAQDVPQAGYRILVLNTAEFEEANLHRWHRFYGVLYPNGIVDIWDCWSNGCISRAKELALQIQDWEIQIAIVLHDPTVPYSADLARLALSEWQLPVLFDDLAWQHTHAPGRA